jgi:hypothetical protein
MSDSLLETGGESTAHHDTVQQDEEHDHRATLARLGVDPDPVPMQSHNGYTLASLREVAEHLAWDSFGEGELNQINRMAMILAAQVRARHAARRSAARQAAMAAREPQPVVLTRDIVYPEGSRHE